MLREKHMGFQDTNLCTFKTPYNQPFMSHVEDHPDLRWDRMTERYHCPHCGMYFAPFQVPAEIKDKITK